MKQDIGFGMNSKGLTGMRVLVVEDEYLLADDTRQALLEQGAEVIGPVPTVEGASACLAAGSPIDAALLDINLRGEMAYEVADALQARGIPFVFVTGYDRCVLPTRFADVVSLPKPLRPEHLSLLSDLITEARQLVG